mmetsp:Transcript_22779/g.70447  ORF Transcript_22779/g.70447 Transcript_22779/m.70447 type:complete len:289 (+) Transcript_22779:562-1428(+)
MARHAGPRARPLARAAVWQKGQRERSAPRHVRRRAPRVQAPRHQIPADLRNCAWLPPFRRLHSLGLRRGRGRLLRRPPAPRRAAARHGALRPHAVQRGPERPVLVALRLPQLSHPLPVRPRDRLPRRPLRFAPQRGGGLGLQPRAPLPRPGGQLHGLRAAGRAAFDGDRPPDRSPVPLGARGVARGHLRRRLAAPVRAAARRSAISRRRRRGRAPGSSASTPRPRRDGSPRSLDCRAGARAAATSGRGAIAKRRIRASGANRAPPDASAPSLGPGRRRRGGTDATRGL